jgi:hypothetical protein
MEANPINALSVASTCQGLVAAGSGNGRAVSSAIAEACLSYAIKNSDFVAEDGRSLLSGCQRRDYIADGIHSLAARFRMNLYSWLMNEVEYIGLGRRRSHAGKHGFWLYS